MTARTQASDTQRKDGQIVSIPVLASEKIYKGSTVLVSSAGYAFTNDGTTNVLANGDVFAGICVETVDNSDGCNGIEDVQVYKTGSFLMTFSDSLTQANVGDKVYLNNVSDDGVVTVTSDTGNPEVCIGIIVDYVSSSTAYVKIDQYSDKMADSTVGDVEIADNSITNAKINTSAGIAFSKLATLTDGNILVGNGSNVATSVAMSGDATIDNAGALTIADDAITQDKFDFEVVTVTVTAGTSGTGTCTDGSVILGFHTTAITGSENVKTVDVSGTTVTVTLTGSDTATVKVVLLKPTV